MYIPTPQIPNNAPPVMGPAAAAAAQQLQSQVSSGNEAMARLNAAAAVAVAKNQLQHMQVRSRVKLGKLILKFYMTNYKMPCDAGNITYYFNCVDLKEVNYTGLVR